MRIAHFSDLHLLSLDGARFIDFLSKRWIGALNLVVSRGRHHQTSVFDAMVADLNENPVDHIVCTGDVTNLALEGEFRFARARFDQIGVGAREVTVVPGNHDAYVPRGTKFFQGYFADYHESDDDWHWDDGDPWPVVRVRGDVAIIGLSTSRATPWFTAYGRVGEKQLDRLAAVLGDSRLSGKFRLLLIHHSPTGKRSESRIRGLRDRDRFSQVIAEHGAELILHGHEHLDLLHELPGPDGTPIPILGIQSGSYEAGKPRLRARYRVFEFGQEADRPVVRQRELRVWDPAQSRFVSEAVVA